MARSGITAYDLLISCPTDVDKFVPIAKECIENFNRFMGEVNNTILVGKHWSTDSFPQSGDRPQEILNNQFVRDCDAAIVVFWTRFGTPTDKYGSGTEEEIEEMLAANKQVFMYFLDAPVSPSSLDQEQYNKVLAFKEKYKDKGVYFTIKDENEFKKLLSNHLNLYFFQKITGTEEVSILPKAPALSISSIYQVDDDNNCTLNSTELCKSTLIGELEKEIESTINKIKSTPLHKRTDSIDKSATNDASPSSAQDLVLNLTKPSHFLNADLSEDCIQTIQKYIEGHNITISNAFWNVGNLKKYGNTIQTLVGNGPTFSGTDEEKARYSDFDNLFWKIKEYNDYIAFFQKIDSLSLAELSISNKGTSFDEDIDIKLIFPKGYIVSSSKIATPGWYSIEKVLSLDFVERIFKIKETPEIESYTGYPPMKHVYTDMIPRNPFNNPSIKEQYLTFKTKYQNEVDHVFCYKEFSTEKNDILTFHIGYLKHNTTMAFPSCLLFDAVPEYMEYEITSKYIAEVIKGKIHFNN